MVLKANLALQRPSSTTPTAVAGVGAETPAFRHGEEAPSFPWLGTTRMRLNLVCDAEWKTMVRRFPVPLLPDAGKERMLAGTFGCARFVYNRVVLDLRSRAWRERQERIRLQRFVVESDRVEAR